MSDSDKLRDWVLRLNDIVREMQNSAGAHALADEITDIEAVAETLDSMIED